MKTKVSKFKLFNTFANGLPFNEIGANIIISIEREDSSNESYNVTVQVLSGFATLRFWN